eukprot:TRINITY_DN35567_c1_g1_i2.p1 TRINITY_DN35567_c1_g1~~TRINITY_DN35567_c1_g1_i2.p1  ORF type:complete len:293 (+),score=24.27 TRINITY_DN35567_c1_g1_i2:82-879(+)
MSLEHEGNFVFRCFVPMGIPINGLATTFDDKIDLANQQKEIGPTGAQLYGISVDTASIHGQLISIQTFYSCKENNRALVCPKRGNQQLRQALLNNTTITFDRDEWVVRVEVWWGYQIELDTELVHAFRVLTNKNRWISFWYHAGEPSGDHAYIEIPNGFQLAGFFGTEQNDRGINSLGIYITPVLSVLYRQLPSSFINLAKVFLESVGEKFPIPRDVQHQLYKAFVRVTFQRSWEDQGPKNNDPVLEELIGECQKLITIKFIPAA